MRIIAQAEYGTMMTILLNRQTLRLRQNMDEEKVKQKIKRKKIFSFFLFARRTQVVEDYHEICYSYFPIDNKSVKQFHFLLIFLWLDKSNIAYIKA